MYDRRTVLRVLGAGAVTGLAGCSDGGGGDGGATESATPTATESATPTATESATPTPTESATPTESGERRVDMTDDLNFDPETVTVPVGGKVVWETTGQVPHSVTAYEADLPAGATYFASGEFESESAARSAYPDGSVAAGETYSHTFETAGEFPYFCIPHESAMVGTVVVE